MEKGAVVDTLTVMSRDELSGRWRCRCSQCKRRPLVAEEALLARTARCGCTKGKPSICLPDEKPEQWGRLAIREKASKMRGSPRNTLGYRGRLAGANARSVQGQGYFRKTEIR